MQMMICLLQRCFFLSFLPLFFLHLLLKTDLSTLISGTTYPVTEQPFLLTQVSPSVNINTTPTFRQ